MTVETAQLIVNRDNLADATTTATGVVPSLAYRRTIQARTGGGDVVLTGAYTGNADTEIEVEVLNSSISGVPLTSEPSFQGVGSGTIESISIDAGTAAQRIRVTLVDTGTKTTAASYDLGVARIVAQTAGADGNDIEITVDESGLTEGLVQYSTPEGLSEGESEVTGAGWDFGAKSLTPEGTIPAGAPRFRFAGSRAVYRQYRARVEGEWRYYITPAPQEDIAARTRVIPISGGRTVTITDGVSTENYSNIATIYDLLAALSSSSLVEVDGVVADDRTPGGMGALDLDLVTESYVARVSGTGSRYARDLSEMDVTVTDTPGESLTVECVDSSVLGYERWDVFGPVSGDLGQATSGQAFAEGGYAFTIPQAFPPTTNGGAINIRDELLPREPEESIPAICSDRPVLGAAARNAVYRFVWTRRPAAECECPAGRVSGAPSPDCLGIESDLPGGGDMSEIASTIATRYQTAVTAWNARLAENAKLDDPDDTDDPLEADPTDIALINDAFRIVISTLVDVDAKIGGGIPTAAASAWDSHLTTIDDELSWLANPGQEIDDLPLQDSDGNLINTAETAIRARGEAGVFDLSGPLLEKYRGLMRDVYVKAGLVPPFDDAGNPTGPGGDCWRDEGGRAWFVSEDGLLPIQPGHYYHSSRRIQDSDGNQRITSTQEFGIGIKVGCEEALKEGDVLVIEVSGVSGSGAYQVGDRVTIESRSAGPAALDGGQDGDDTLTWSVVGSEDGALADYALNTGTENAYDDGGVAFTIKPGAISFRAGDRYEFWIEGGNFRWRRDGGSWTTAQIQPTVALVDGLSLSWRTGAAPSFNPGDAYSFDVESQNGPGRLLSPADLRRRFRYTGGTTISTPGGPASCLLMAGHSIPEGATITLQGSDDAFVSQPLDVTVPWREGLICYTWDETDYAAYRIIITGAGSIAWLWIGTPLAFRKVGTWEPTTSYRVSVADAVNPAARFLGAGGGGTVSWPWLDENDRAALFAALRSVHESDAGRLGIVHASHADEASFVVAPREVTVRDRMTDYQARDKAARIHELSLDLEPVIL